MNDCEIQSFKNPSTVEGLIAATREHADRWLVAQTNPDDFTLGMLEGVMLSDLRELIDKADETAVRRLIASFDPVLRGVLHTGTKTLPDWPEEKRALLEEGR